MVKESIADFVPRRKSLVQGMRSSTAIREWYLQNNMTWSW